MRNSHALGLCCCTVILLTAAAAAAPPVLDTGETAMNGSTPSPGDDVTTGGWSYIHAPLGDHSGVYHSGAAHDGALGIRLVGHGTHITSHAFGEPYGVASVDTRIVDASGGVPNADALSRLSVWSGTSYVAISPTSGDFDFYWQVYDGVTTRRAAIAGVSCDNTDWWHYEIELTPGGDAVFTVDDGTNTGSATVAHGIAGDFDHCAVMVDRWSTGWEVATADYDNLTFVPEPTAVALLALGGLGLIRRTRRHGVVPAARRGTGKEQER